MESQSRGALVQCVNQPKVPSGKHDAWGLLWACPCRGSQRSPCMTCTGATWASKGPAEA